MKVIVVGGVNEENLLFSGSLRAVTGEENFLDRFLGGKFDLREYRIRHGRRATRYSLSFRRKVRGRTTLEFLGPGRMELFPGGSALSIAIGLKRMGAKVALATPMIEFPIDFFFAQIQEEARVHGIRMLPSFGNQINPLSFVIWGFNKGKEQSVVFPYKPPYAMTSKKTLDALRTEEGVTHVIVTGIRRMEELKFIARVFRTVHIRNPDAVTFFMPNASLLPRTPQDVRQELLEVLKETSIWQMNAREAGIYLGDTSLSFAERVRALAKKGSVATTIVTRGARGAAAVINGVYYEVPPVDALVADDAGAGDAFAVGFLGAIELGCEDPKERLRLAAFAASENIKKVGGWAGNPTRTALQRYLSELRRGGT